LGKVWEPIERTARWLSRPLGRVFDDSVVDFFLDLLKFVVYGLILTIGALALKGIEFLLRLVGLDDPALIDGLKAAKSVTVYAGVTFLAIAVLLWFIRATMQEIADVFKKWQEVKRKTFGEKRSSDEPPT
jgi:hypothetical protein